MVFFIDGVVVRVAMPRDAWNLALQQAAAKETKPRASHLLQAVVEAKAGPEY